MANSKHPSSEQEPNPGVILLPLTSLHPFAYNREALQILAFPENPEAWRLPASALARQIGDKLTPTTSSGRRSFAPNFKSGKRTYICHALSLGSERGSSKWGAGTVILLQRIQPAGLLPRKAYEKLGLTKREGQLVELLVKGMTTKEMAVDLELSPNTIKSFLRLIMAKMGVSTRSGVVGKLLEADRH